MSAKAGKLAQILKELEKNSEVDGSAIVSPKGQLMASALHADINPQGVAAMAAALTSVGARVGKTLNAGDPGQMVLAGSKRLIIVNSLTNAILIALAPADAKVGLIDFEVSQALDKIKTTLG